MFRFKPTVLSKFLIKRFFSSFLLVMLTVCGIIYIVTFVERLGSNPDTVSTLLDSWIRLLEYIPLFLPLAVFMGTLLAFYNLTKSSELIIISGTGLSPFQIARPFLFGAFIVGAIATTVVNPYSVQISTNNLTKNHLELVDDNIWLRENSEENFLTLRANGMHIEKNNNIRFDNVLVFLQNDKFKLTNRISAPYAILSDTGLTIENANNVDDKANVSKTTEHIKTKITPQTVLERYLQPDQISFWKLPAFIRKMDSIGVMTRGHLVQFWTLLFLPLTMMAMVTLGIAFSQTKQRRNYSFGVKFSLGILTCFVLYFIVHLFNALGNTGTLPPLIAIIAPQIIIITGACTFITTYDTI